MQSVQEIEEAVASLGPKQLSKFRQWFTEFDSQAWDEQIEKDVHAAKLDGLAQSAIDEYKEGSFREL